MSSTFVIRSFVSTDESSKVFACIAKYRDYTVALIAKEQMLAILSQLSAHIL